MPALVAALARVLLWALGSWLGRLLLNLGVGYVAYKGADVLIQKVTTDVVSNLSGLSQAAGQLVIVCNVPQALSILFAAIAFRFSLAATKRIVFNPK